LSISLLLLHLRAVLENKHRTAVVPAPLHPLRASV
jgi:hypothetical protein